jgi:hypothetical protein
LFNGIRHRDKKVVSVFVRFRAPLHLTQFYILKLYTKKGLLELPLIFNKLVEINPAAELIILVKMCQTLFRSSTWENDARTVYSRSFVRVNYVWACAIQQFNPYKCS